MRGNVWFKLLTRCLYHKKSRHLRQKASVSFFFKGRRGNFLCRGEKKKKKQQKTNAQLARTMSYTGEPCEGYAEFDPTDKKS